MLPDIGCNVLEVGDDDYSRCFGRNKVYTIDVLDIDPQKSSATIIADLTDCRQIPNDTFDCLLITQILCLINNLEKVVGNLVRILKPGGVILCTQPSITRVSSFSGERENWFWSLYPASAKLLFSRVGIEKQTLLVESWGNLKTATAFLWRLAKEYLSEDDFLLHDFRFPMVTSVRAVKDYEGDI